jgi:hypothetical protein
MMNRLRFVLWLTLLLFVVACGGEDEPASPAAQEQVLLPTPTLSVDVPTPIPPPPVIVIEESGDSSDAEPAPPEVVNRIRPWPVDKFGYGIQIHGDATYGDAGRVMDVVRNQLGLNWIKVQLQWQFVHPEPGVEQWFFYDDTIQKAVEQDLNIMLSVVKAPAWTRAAGNPIGPPDDYNEYASFLTELINRYPNQIGAIEVWNEQNLDREWQTANGTSPEDYVRFLQVAYETIKAADPNIVVISGALSPTGPGDWVRWADDFEYMDRALAAGMLNYADCVGAHHNGYNVPPDVRVEDTNTLPESQTAEFRGPFDNQYTNGVLNHLWTFKTTIDGYVERIQAVDPAMKLCITEFGWASSEGYDVVPDTFEFANDNTLQEQADYIVQAYQQTRDSGNVWLVFLFNFDYGNKGTGPEDDPVPYSIIDTIGAPRPAFGAIAAMDKPD